MTKQGKKYRAALEKVEPGRNTLSTKALAKVKEIAFAKFDETVELTMWLGVDPRKADQLVRGTVVLPHGSERPCACSSSRRARRSKRPRRPGPT